MSHVPSLPLAPRGADLQWLIDGRLSAPASRTRSLNRDLDIQKTLTFITLHQTPLVTVERELADELHDYIVFTTHDEDDRIHVDIRPQDNGLMVVINSEHFVVTLAGLNQFVVFRTQGGNDLIHIAENVTRPILVDSGEGDDHIFAGGGYTRIFAGPGNDIILNHRGPAYIEGGDGADQIFSLADGEMTVYAGAGDDKVIAASGLAFINGGEGDDQLTGGSAHNILTGGPGNDLIQAGPRSNVLYTGEGLDVVTQLKPDDKVFANPNSGLAAAGQFIAHGLTPSDTSPECPHPQALVTDIQPLSLQNSGIRVIGSVEFQQRVNDDLQLLANSPNGQHLFRALDAAELRSGTPINIYELQDEANGLFVPSPASTPPSFIQDNRPGTPSYGGAVYYNPSFIGNRMSNIPLLYHELCHAYNVVTGTSLQGASLDGADGNKPRPIIPNHELQAVGLPTDAIAFDFDNDPSTPPTHTNATPFTENGIREELGMPPRKQYSSPPI
ncbi:MULTISPECIES: M91 family zinc metallopeptidase [Pseudomonas]|uniref:M91 family zinc metallopeptidase n=1 Tax=Pseudomonas TaxID=286 RepID=UPI001AE539F3|nr:MULTISPECIES: M91 family zinc metallopeptidase [unclassified Pseudomonas]MBP1125753.1 hypothetical protein [Pseudomonas sp. PvP025]MDQ0399613.1 hypothetical protein [Pseudomonas sp. PvP006]